MDVKQLDEQLEQFRKQVDGDIFGGILLYHLELQCFVLISYGDGSNLLDEDETAGFDDYVYIQIDKFNDGVWESDIDGGQMMLKMKEDWEDHYNICQHVRDALDYIGMTEEVIILQSFKHR